MRDRFFWPAMWVLPVAALLAMNGWVVVVPWLLIAFGAWFALCFLAAPFVGRFFGLTNDTHTHRHAPPAHPRARLVLERDRAGHVEIKPNVRDHA